MGTVNIRRLAYPAAASRSAVLHALRDHADRPRSRAERRLSEAVPSTPYLTRTSARRHVAAQRSRSRRLVLKTATTRGLALDLRRSWCFAVLGWPGRWLRVGPGVCECVFGKRRLSRAGVRWTRARSSGA